MEKFKEELFKDAVLVKPSNGLSEKEENLLVISVVHTLCSYVSSKNKADLQRAVNLLRLLM